MTQEDDDFDKYAAFHNIAEFSDLSIAEIIALLFLGRYKDPVVRHTLYTEIKQLIEFKENDPYKNERKTIEEESSKKFLNATNGEKKYYSSSFYNSLKNLMDKGLLQINKKEKGTKTKTTIEPTPYTQFVPKILLKFLINNNIMDSPDFFLEEIMEKIGNQKFEKVLSIWFTEYEVLSIVSQLSKFATEVYILSKNVSNGDINKVKMKDVKHIDMIENDKMFSIPNSFFDGVLVPVYKQNPKFFGMSRQEILAEIKRTCKPEGLIGLVAITPVPLTDNFFMNELIKLYNIALNNRIFTREDLKKDMKDAGLKNIEIHSHKGLLIGVSQNS
jgi:hypothetical protein